MKKPAISEATIDRLPLYFRCLERLQKNDRSLTSSEELGKLLGLAPEQIRKDLTAFGQFGKKGVGYYVSALKEKISAIIGLDKNLNLAVVGVENLGTILATDPNILSLGFKIVALFDNSAKIIGTSINDVKVQSPLWIRRTTKERNVHIGIITVAAAHAQNAADELIAGGVKGIWNFAPVKLEVPTNIALIREDLSVSLANLAYHITNQ